MGLPANQITRKGERHEERKELWTLVVLVCPLTSLGLDLNLMGGPIALAPGIDTSFSFQLWVQSEEAFNGAQFLFLFDNDEMNDL
ncbi:MAG: hypothetical protein GXY44_04055 [Phycisphaerales bacterium]|nr:hypothetical protein [Phycisphaerales bacterium]